MKLNRKSARYIVFVLVTMLTLLLNACDRKPAGEKQVGEGLDKFFQNTPTAPCSGIVC
jgi:hypothetical protein